MLLLLLCLLSLTPRCSPGLSTPMNPAFNIKLLSILSIGNAASAEYNPFWENLIRALTQTQETFENSPNCGKISQARSKRQEQDQCLSSCTWQKNPLFKQTLPFDYKISADTSVAIGRLLFHWSKWSQQPWYGTSSSWYPLLNDYAMVPTDLSCLSGCFKKYLKPNLLTKIQQKCSENGLDRQVPTHTTEGNNFAQSPAFEVFQTGRDLTRSYGFDFWLSLNPNLDCLVYYETKQRKGCRTDGVCNFISDPGSLLGNLGNRHMTKRDHKTTTIKQTPATTVNDRIEANVYDYLLRSSSPLVKAVAMCAIAKMVELVKDALPNFDPNLNPDFDIDDFYPNFSSPTTCDDFMPDIFDSLCSCVGTCVEDGSNLISKFNIESGLWGCQDLCKNTTDCEFYTLKNINTRKPTERGSDGGTQCSLWRKCDQFRIPQQREWLDLRSGPADCSLYNQECPVVLDMNGPLSPLPDDYEQLPDAECPCSPLIGSPFPSSSILFPGQSYQVPLGAPGNSSCSWCFKGEGPSPWRPKPKKRKRNDQRKGAGRKGHGKKRKKSHKVPRKKKAGKFREKNRVLGSATTSLSEEESNSFPWMCSLKEAGFTGRHRCGVTLLSGPESSEVVLVSAAHCNFMCKDKDNNIVEICCCRHHDQPESCLPNPRNPSDDQRSSYCGREPRLHPAKPSEMNIVCSEFSLAIQPEQVSVEKEVVLEIRKITNFPGYQQGTNEDKGENLKGPYAGGDIAVYHITPKSKEKAKKSMEGGTLSPACLPESSYASSKGVFAGWLDQEPFYRLSTTNIKIYEREYLTIKTVEVEKVECKDPDWMKTETFYPASTECYRDPSQASCFSFGNSGSGVLRKTTIDGEERYSFAGPLSMTKSCDLAYIFDNQISYNSANPGIFTDAHCYLPWIAASYGMKLPEGYTYKASCGESRGKRDVIDEATCLGQDAESLRRSRCQNWQSTYATEYECQQDLVTTGFSGTGFCSCQTEQIEETSETSLIRECDFENQRYTKNGMDIPWDQCFLEAREGYAYNIYMCKDRYGNNMTCANNCRGVNPNAVIIGGTAVLAAAAVTPLQVLTPLGLGALGGGAAVVGQMMNRRSCPATRPCRARDRGNPRRRKCCRAFGAGQGRLRCPRTC